MTTQPNSGEEQWSIQGPMSQPYLDCGPMAMPFPQEFTEPMRRMVELHNKQLTQLRAERDGLKIKVEKIQQTAFEIAEEGKAYKAERDRLKEELDKGKSAMKTMSDLFSVTSQKCGTLESDNARLAAEVERLKAERTDLASQVGKLDRECDHIVEGLKGTISRLTAELEAAKGERDATVSEYNKGIMRWAHRTAVAEKALKEIDEVLYGDKLHYNPDRALTIKTMRELSKTANDALAALVRELREKEESWKRLVLNLQSLLNSTPPDEGEIARDVFNPAESDLDYARRRARELGVTPPPNPEGAGEESSNIGLGEWLNNIPTIMDTTTSIPRPDTQGDERDQCLCPECCPTTQGEKEYRMLEPEKDRLQRGDERLNLYSPGWSPLHEDYFGQVVQPNSVGHFRRPITPPTTGGLSEPS